MGSRTTQSNVQVKLLVITERRIIAGKYRLQSKSCFQRRHRRHAAESPIAEGTNCIHLPEPGNIMCMATPQVGVCQIIGPEGELIERQNSTKTGGLINRTHRDEQAIAANPPPTTIHFRSWKIQSNRKIQNR